MRAAAQVGAPLSGYVSLKDAYGQPASMAAAEVLFAQSDAPLLGESALVGALHADPTLQESGCTARHCLHGQRVVGVTAAANDTVAPAGCADASASSAAPPASVLLCGYSISGASGVRYLSALARGEGWTASASLEVTLRPCDPGWGVVDRKRR